LKSILEIPTLRVLNLNDKVFLSLPTSEQISIGDPIHAEIDWNRRYAYMQCHTAAHVVMGVLKREVQNYSPIGINISETGDIVTAKFNGSWRRQMEDAKSFIERANEIIGRDINITIDTYKDISAAVNKYNEIYRGPREFSGEVRIITINGWDANPCGGTHVKHTGEIGYLRLVNFGIQEIAFSLIRDEK